MSDVRNDDYHDAAQRLSILFHEGWTSKDIQNYADTRRITFDEAVEQFYAEIHDAE